MDSVLLTDNNEYSSKALRYANSDNIRCETLWKWSDGIVNKEWHKRFFVLDKETETL